MSLKLKTVIPHRKINKCKHCRISHLCLPAHLNRKVLKVCDKLHFKSRLLKPGEYLCRQGEYSEHLYAIRSGILKSTITKAEGEEFIMGFHLPPDLFGWEGLEDSRTSTSVIAIDQSNVCQIPLESLSDLFSELPELEKRLFQLMSRRIHRDNEAMLRTTVEQRVANFILQLTEYYRLLGHPYYLCKLEMTHQDIANYLRIAPETISRTFKNLQKKLVIQMSRKKIWIKNLKVLHEIAEQDPPSDEPPDVKDLPDEEKFTIL